jgi:uncharacterized protein YybS (DUF2232 family)
MGRKVVIGSVRAAALSGGFFLAAGAIPLFGEIAMLLSPAPILIFAVGRASANLRALCTVLLAALLVSALSATFAGASLGLMVGGRYLATFGIATIVMTWMIGLHRPFELVLVAAAGAMCTAAVAVALIAAGGPIPLVKAVQTLLSQMMVQGQEGYRTLGIPNPMPPEAQAAALDSMIRILPALGAISASLSVMFNLRVFWRWAGKQRLSYPLFGDLLRWSAPEWLIWGLIASGFGMLAPIAAVRDIAVNSFLCFAVVYLCQGLAIMAFYFQALAVPGVVRAIIYFVVLGYPFVAAVGYPFAAVGYFVVPVIVCLAGVFDMWIDFRRLKPPSQEAGNYGDFL